MPGISKKKYNTMIYINCYQLNNKYNTMFYQKKIQHHVVIMSITWTKFILVKISLLEAYQEAIPMDHTKHKIFKDEIIGQAQRMDGHPMCLFLTNA